MVSLCIKGTGWAVVWLPFLPTGKSSVRCVDTFGQLLVLLGSSLYCSLCFQFGYLYRRSHLFCKARAQKSQVLPCGNCQGLSAGNRLCTARPQEVPLTGTPGDLLSGTWWPVTLVHCCAPAWISRYRYSWFAFVPGNSLPWSWTSVLNSSLPLLMWFFSGNTGFLILCDEHDSLPFSGLQCISSPSFTENMSHLYPLP